jgi:hypothetical protein
MFRIVLLVVILCYSCVNAWQSSSISGKRYSSLTMLANGRRPLMGGNWKLNPKSVQESINLATEVAKLTKGVSDVDVVLVIKISSSSFIIFTTLISSLYLPSSHHDK